jgi:hypothetical protein
MTETLNEWLNSLDDGERQEVNTIGKWELADRVWHVARRSIPQGDELPPLPEPDVIGYTCIGENDAYSPAKVREYGAACRASGASGASGDDLAKAVLNWWEEHQYDTTD